jgi:hypothetical protein
MSNPSNYRNPTAWAGFVVLAAVLMCIVGVFNFVTGLVAVFNDTIYSQRGSVTVVLDVTGWGWFHIVWGILLFGTGMALYAGMTWARVVAIVLVSVNMITQLMEMPAYPLWGLAILALDILILWAIIVHGAELKDS